MNPKLSKLFRFRDNYYFKFFEKIFIVLVFIYFLIAMSFICAGNSNAYVLFALIPLLFIASFFRKNDYLILLGEFITIAGDVALMIYHYEPVGFSIYIFVQLSYAAYFFFRDSNKNRQIIITIIRPIMMGLACLLAYLIMKNSFNLVMAFAVMYFVNLLTNIVCAIILKDKLLIIAFTIFALSDLIIGMNMLLPDGNVFKNFLNSFNFLHFLYLPSQVIIMLNKNKNNYFNTLEEVK